MSKPNKKQPVVQAPSPQVNDPKTPFCEECRYWHFPNQPHIVNPLIVKDFPSGNVADSKPKNLFGHQTATTEWWSQK